MSFSAAPFFRGGICSDRGRLRAHPGEVVSDEGDGEAGAEDVGDGLADLDAGEADEAGQDDDAGDKEEAAPGAGKERRFFVAPGDLEQHVGESGHGQGDERHTVGAEGEGADLRNARIGILKQGDDLRRKDEKERRQTCQHDQAGTDAEFIRFDDAVVALGAEVVAGHGLETLPEADQDGTDEHGHAHDDGHGRERGVAVDGGAGVERDTGQRSHALAKQRRHAGADD